VTECDKHDVVMRFLHAKKITVENHRGNIVLFDSTKARPEKDTQIKADSSSNMNTESKLAPSSSTPQTQTSLTQSPGRLQSYSIPLIPLAPLAPPVKPFPLSKQYFGVPEEAALKFGMPKNNYHKYSLPDNTSTLFHHPKQNPPNDRHTKKQEPVPLLRYKPFT